MSSKNSSWAGFFGVLVVLALTIAAAYGWIENIILLAHGNESTCMALARIIGIVVFFVGAVLGYIT